MSRRVKKHSVLEVLVGALVVGVAAAILEVSPVVVVGALRQVARGRSRSRSGPPVAWLQRVPKGGVRA